jgi:hypothetical protein
MNVGGRGASSYDPQVGEWKREEMKMRTFSRLQNSEDKAQGVLCRAEQSRADKDRI